MIEQLVNLERMEEAIDIFGSFDENMRLIAQLAKDHPEENVAVSPFLVWISLTGWGRKSMWRLSGTMW